MFDKIRNFFKLDSLDFKCFDDDWIVSPAKLYPGDTLVLTPEWKDSTRGMFVKATLFLRLEDDFVVGIYTRDPGTSRV